MTAADRVPPSPEATAERREEVAAVLDRVVSMARVWPDISAVALCGPWAGGRADMGADVELCMVVRWRSDLAKDPGWLAGQIAVGARFLGRQDRGRLRTDMRYQLRSGLEVEVALVDRSWAAADPPDAATAAVVCTGFIALHDPKALLAALRDAVDDA